MKLRDIAIAIPSKNFDAEEISKWCSLDITFIKNKIGVERRAFLGPKETLNELAKEACEKLLLRNQLLSRDKIQLVILVTQNPDYKLPHTSALIHSDLDLNPNTACFDVNLGCSGYVYALSIARGIMKTEGLAEGILITCDPYSRIMVPSDRITFALFGDAATATWLSMEEGAEIGKADLGTDGSGANHLIVKAGGSAFPLSSVWYPDGNVPNPEDLRLYMNGRAILKYMIEHVPESVYRCLEMNHVSISEVDYFIFHQASKLLLEKLTSKMGLNVNKVPSNLNHFGNTVSSSIPILLAQMIDQGLLFHKKVVVSGFGVGLSWATNIVQF